MGSPDGGGSLRYRRSRFATHLPLDAVYSLSHSWAVRRKEGMLRIGLTRFATRMLGDMVDHGFETAKGAPVSVGEILGWVEGFKAISDIYCIASGDFLGGNPRLAEDITLISTRPYGEGWLYEVRGEPDSRCLDAAGYSGVLDATIDRMLQEEKANED